MTSVKTASFHPVDSQGPSNHPTTARPREASGTDATGSVVERLKASAVQSDPKKTAEKAAKWWLEPAGYEKMPSNEVFIHGEGDITQGSAYINGVLKISDDLVGVITNAAEAKEGEPNKMYWVSRFENPAAFSQALDWFEQIQFPTAELTDPSFNGYSTMEEADYMRAGYVRYDPDEVKVEVDPENIEGVFIKTNDDMAAFTLRNEDGTEGYHYLSKTDYPKEFDMLVDVRNKRRRER